MKKTLATIFAAAFALSACTDTGLRSDAPTTTVTATTTEQSAESSTPTTTTSSASSSESTTPSASDDNVDEPAPAYTPPRQAPESAPSADCPAYQCGYGTDEQGNQNPTSGDIQAWWAECTATNTTEYCRANDPYQ